VISRGGKLIKGKAAIADFCGKNLPVKEKVTLTWEPEFVDVSSSGDMAFTYGTFRHSVVDSAGKCASSTGIFHTVWKRQRDGSWKFVWD
jgi:ketosteroid isomerase-like protein